MSEHAKGPWALMDIGDYTDFDGRSQVIMSEDLSGENPYRIAVVHVNGEEDEEGKANARLIAAAPAMREALEKMTKLLPLLRQITVGQVIEMGDEAINAVGLNPWCMNEGLANGTERAVDGWFIDKIESAIAKARGEGVEG